MAPLPVRVVDTHVHFWHPKRLKYAWLHDIALLDREEAAVAVSHDAQPFPDEPKVAV